VVKTPGGPVDRPPLTSLPTTMRGSPFGLSSAEAAAAGHVGDDRVGLVHTDDGPGADVDACDALRAVFVARVEPEGLDGVVLHPEA